MTEAQIKRSGMKPTNRMRWNTRDRIIQDRFDGLTVCGTITVLQQWWEETLTHISGSGLATDLRDEVVGEWRDVPHEGS
ncbi:MAG TPA: hypothetical protein VJU83_07330 [Burkholderiales bacterium]|nr:hypothetical protein [Burkholderiales bacterium]